MIRGQDITLYHKSNRICKICNEAGQFEDQCVRLQTKEELFKKQLDRRKNRMEIDLETDLDLKE